MNKDELKDAAIMLGVATVAFNLVAVSLFFWFVVVPGWMK